MNGDMIVVTRIMGDMMAGKTPDAAKLIAALNGMPAKANTASGAKALVAVARKAIRAAIDKGYTYDEIAKKLSEEGLSLKGSTLRQYMAALDRDKKARTRTATTRVAENATTGSTEPATEARTPYNHAGGPSIRR